MSGPNPPSNHRKQVEATRSLVGKQRGGIIQGGVFPIGAVLPSQAILRPSLLPSQAVLWPSRPSIHPVAIQPILPSQAILWPSCGRRRLQLQFLAIHNPLPWGPHAKRGSQPTARVPKEFRSKRSWDLSLV